MCDSLKPKLRQADAADAEAIYRLVQRTIRTCYVTCYTEPVLEAFCRYHSLESIATDIAEGKVFVLETVGTIIGTATLDGSYIGRVYVAPEEQGKGYGSRLMEELEARVALKSPTATLDSSIPGRALYLHRGYVVTREETWEIEAWEDLPADQLTYEIMEKRLRQG